MFVIIPTELPCYLEIVVASIKQIMIHILGK